MNFGPGVLRTPAERFENLQGYPFESNYMEVRVERGVGGQERAPMRMHYVDEGSGDPVLMLHGVPSWSYLFRKMIPPIAENHRVIAPDWIGHGKSDKFIRESDYSFRMHLDSAIAFVEALDLHNVTLVMQDWGGFIGLPLVAAIPDRFARLVLMNTALPTGYGMMTRELVRCPESVSATGKQRWSATVCDWWNHRPGNYQGLYGAVSRPELLRGD